MKRHFALTIVLNALLVWQNCLAAEDARHAQSNMIVEGETTLPLAYDVDLAVAGGSLAGVEAAIAAAQQGASVLLVDSRPYIGYDLCATQKLWLEPGEMPTTPLCRELFSEKRVVTPLEVKRALDKALLDHRVQFLTGTFPAELLVDQDRNPAGLTIVNRSIVARTWSPGKYCAVPGSAN